MGTTVNVTSDNYDFLIWKRSIKIFPCFIFTGEQAYNLLCRKVINNFSYRVLRVYSDCKSIDTNLIFFLVFDRFFLFIFYTSCYHTESRCTIDNSFCSLSGTTCGNINCNIFIWKRGIISFPCSICIEEIRCDRSNNRCQCRRTIEQNLVAFPISRCLCLCIVFCVCGR